MAGNLIKFFYCKYGGLSDSLPFLSLNCFISSDWNHAERCGRMVIDFWNNVPEPVQNRSRLELAGANQHVEIAVREEKYYEEA